LKYKSSDKVILTVPSCKSTIVEVAWQEGPIVYLKSPECETASHVSYCSWAYETRISLYIDPEKRWGEICLE
jgi:hypothetical protein